MEKWREYCETLYTNTDNDTYDLEPGPAEPVPTVEEVKKALEAIKSEKAAGPDGIPIELLKLGEDSVVKAMHRIIVCMANKEVARRLDPVDVCATLQERGPFSMCKL